jgi:hypothetical protein
MNLVNLTFHFVFVWCFLLEPTMSFVAVALVVVALAERCPGSNIDAVQHANTSRSLGGNGRDTENTRGEPRRAVPSDRRWCVATAVMFYKNNTSNQARESVCYSPHRAPSWRASPCRAPTKPMAKPAVADVSVSERRCYCRPIKTTSSSIWTAGYLRTDDYSSAIRTSARAICCIRSSQHQRPLRLFEQCDLSLRVKFNANYWVDRRLRVTTPDAVTTNHHNTFAHAFAHAFAHPFAHAKGHAFAHSCANAVAYAIAYAISPRLGRHLAADAESNAVAVADALADAACVVTNAVAHAIAHAIAHAVADANADICVRRLSQLH